VLSRLRELTSRQRDRLMKGVLSVGWLLITVWAVLVCIPGNQSEFFFFYVGLTLVVDYYLLYKWSSRRIHGKESGQGACSPSK
jgi:hypothetical protein